LGSRIIAERQDTATSRSSVEQAARSWQKACASYRVGKKEQVLRKGEMLRSAKRRVQGHLNYYAVTDNWEMFNLSHYHATRSCLSGSTVRAKGERIHGTDTTRLLAGSDGQG
jgi:hypothetical protein